MKITAMLIVFLCLFATFSYPDAPGPSHITGAVAYTEIVRFDYTRDGTRNAVQFWLAFKGREEVGKRGEPGYKPAEGSVWYYLYDVEKKQKVTNWLMGFNMMEEPPPSGPYPMVNLTITSRTARFEAFNMKWVVVDGGEGHLKDQVIVDDGFRPRNMKMYDGDVRVGP